MLRNPCYDRATKTDCPDRKDGCRLHCIEWQKYEKLKFEEYDKKENSVNTHPLATPRSRNQIRDYYSKIMKTRRWGTRK